MHQQNLHSIGKSCYSISHKVRVEDQTEIGEDIKTVYRADDQENGQAALDKFVSYVLSLIKTVMNSLASNEHLLTISQSRYGAAFIQQI